MSDRELAQLCARAYRRATHETETVEALLEGDVLAFRGTDEGLDLFHTLWCRAWYSYPLGCLVHRGVYDAAWEWFDTFRAELRTLPPLTIAAHSLGGCYGLLIAYLMAWDGYPPSRIVTFGSPPVAGARLTAKRHIPATIYRGEHDGRSWGPPLPWWRLYRDHGDVVTVPGCRHGRDEYARLVGH